MKITVTNIEDALSGKNIWFKEALLESRGDDFTNDIGTRVVRILKKLAGQQVMLDFFGDHQISVAHGNLKYFGSKAVLQQQIGKFANSSIKVGFGKPVVRPARSNHPLRTVQEVRAYNKHPVDGFLGVAQEITLSLPVARRDLVRLRKIIPGSVWQAGDVMDRICIRVQLNTDSADPWKLIDSLQPKIKSLIV